MPAIRKKASNKPPIEFTAVDQVPEVVACLAWGRSGTGKTTFASTFPKPMLFLDVREKGTSSISNVKGIKVGRITEWDELEQVFWYLKKGEHEFKTVVIDQITTLQDLAMSKAKKDEGKEDSDASSKRIFGLTGGLMKTWLLNFRDLTEEGIHVIFIAHDRTTRPADDASGDDQLEPEVGPQVMPSVASFLNGCVGIIGNTFIRENFTVENKRRVRHVEYGMRLGPHAYYTTKVRSPVGIAAPESIVDPTYDKLVAIVRGDYSETATAKKRK